MSDDAADIQICYCLVLAGACGALFQARASLLRVLLAPILATPMTLLAAIAVVLASQPLRLIGISSTSVLQVLFGAAVIMTVGYVGGRWLAHYTPTWWVPLPRQTVAARGRSPDRDSRPEPPPPPAPPPASPRVEPPPVAEGTITLAGVPVFPGDESKHFKVIGLPGVGRRLALCEILARALARGDRAIIADPGGVYRRRFYDPERGDVVLSPFDTRACKWHLFGEISQESEDRDIEQLARSLIPESSVDAERIWSRHARTLMSEVIRTGGIRDEHAFLRLVTSAPQAELRQWLAGSPASPLLQEGNERMFGSVRPVASAALRPVEYTARQRAVPFSVRQWVREGSATGGAGGQGVLFLPYAPGEIGVLRSLIAAWLRLAMYEVLEHDEGDQRLWLIVDELTALGPIEGLRDTLTPLGKVGSRCVLGFESITQVSQIYGWGVAEVLVENCGNTLILRCEQEDTAEWASRLIGEREALQVRTLEPRARRSSWGWPTPVLHLAAEPAVPAWEIERLADLEGYLKLASYPDWRPVQVTSSGGPGVRPGSSLATDSAAPPAAETRGRARSVRPAGAAGGPSRARGAEGAGPRAAAQRRARPPKAKAEGDARTDIVVEIPARSEDIGAEAYDEAPASSDGGGS